jgi:NAD(P)-dependent dehydrogenase (short-subunit alcohol dehydrogenase family)
MSQVIIIIITGAGRGLGTDIAREALAAGHQVVATGRRPEEVENTLGGPQDNLLTVELDTNPQDAQTAVHAAVERFGRIDVLINNAENFFAGYFRGDLARPPAPADREQPVRPDERHPRRASRAAHAARWARHHDFLPCRSDRARILRRYSNLDIACKPIKESVMFLDH